LLRRLTLASCLGDHLKILGYEVIGVMAHDLPSQVNPPASL